MTSVAHNHADVVLGCECQGGLDIGVARDVDDIVDVVAQNTRLRLGGEGIAALVGEEGLHHRVGCRVATYRIMSDMRRRRGLEQRTGFAAAPNWTAIAHKRPCCTWDHGMAFQWGRSQ